MNNLVVQKIAPPQYKACFLYKIWSFGFERLLLIKNSNGNDKSKATRR